ncbi:MAG: hypothetical protein R2780_01955 [Crocinitomicaceae bacterium]|nr:hypothetical protein [Crocinitomicaceae bacterium]
MKRYTLLFLLFISTSAISQVTRNEIEVMMTEIGTSIDKMEELFVGNVMDYYQDGTSKQTYDKYKSEKGNVFKLTDNGIKAIYQPEGKVKSVFFVPYSNILTIDIGVNYMTIYIQR